MKTIFSAVLVVALAGGLVWWFGFREPPPPEPPKDPSLLIGKTTQRTGGGGVGGRPKFPKMPGAGGLVPPGLNVRSSGEMFAEFAEEMEFSPAKTAEFLKAVEESNKAMMAGIEIDSSTGLPKLPAPEEMEANIEEKERILTGVLGSDGYEKYKAFTSTMSVRGILNDEFGSGESKLGIEAKKDVLYGAYEDLRSGNPPSSPQQFSEMLTAAVLKRSAEHLSDKDQDRLNASLKKHFADQMQMLGGGGGIPGLPNLPPIPAGGPGPGGLGAPPVTPVIPGGAP